MDIKEIEHRLYQRLLSLPNVTFHLDREITYLQKSKEIKGTVESVTIGYGPKAKEVRCDALVLCNGWQIASTLRQHLRTAVPVIPVKQYSLNFKSYIPY